MSRIRTAFISVVPSPYQRDLFGALAQRPEVELSVYYLEKDAPDSPWPEKSLARYEKYLPGFWFPLGTARIHVNWALPPLHSFDVVVLNTLMSVTGQWLMRGPLRGRRWMFWGERLRRGGQLHERLSAPLNRAAGIAAIGSWAENDYRERFTTPRMFNIPYHCDLSAFRDTPRNDRNNSRVTFLFCGQMIARKGVDLLLKAFRQLDSRAELLLVGREAELPEMMRELPADICRRIRYAGFQPPDALPEYFSKADVFVLPSRYDGWGVVVNQALGAGLPVLCSETVGAGFDLVEAEINGLKFPPNSADSLATCMRRFLDEPDLIENWGNASRQKALSVEPSTGAAKWVEALQRVMTA